MSWNTNDYSNIQKSPLYTTRSGGFGYPNAGSFYNQASFGFLWSSTANSGTVAYSLGYNSSGVIPAYRNNRQNGFPVRCIAHFSGSSDFGYLLVEQGITSSFGTADQDLSWNTDGYVKIQSSPLYTTQSGAFTGGSFNYQSYGFLWSDTTYSSTNVYSLNYSSSNVTPANFNNRQNGFPVRCIAHFSGSSDFGYLLVEQGITSSFGTAGQTLNWNIDGYVKIQSSPLYTTQSGYFYGGNFDYQASRGRLWSGTTISSTIAYYLSYDSSDVVPARNYYRYNGFPVRCITQ